jgi:hypothetical protein
LNCDSVSDDVKQIEVEEQIVPRGDFIEKKGKRFMLSFVLTRTILGDEIAAIRRMGGRKPKIVT